MQNNTEWKFQNKNNVNKVKCGFVLDFIAWVV